MLYTPKLAGANTRVCSGIEIENILGVSCDNALKNDITIETEKDLNYRLKSLLLIVDNNYAPSYSSKHCII